MQGPKPDVGPTVTIDVGNGYWARVGIDGFRMLEATVAITQEQIHYESAGDDQVGFASRFTSPVHK